MANQQDDCTKNRKITFVGVLSKMGNLLAKILCQALLTLLQGLSTLFTAELAVVTVELALAETFVTNFVVFPLNATTATIKQTTDVVDKLTGYGFGPGCPSTDRLNKVIKESRIGRLSALGRKLKTAADSAQASINGLKKLSDNLGKIGDDINSLTAGLCDRFN